MPTRDPRDTDTHALRGYPRGWFVVAFSEEIPPGEPHPMRYFGEELVAFRDGAGEVAVLSAHCPHLGAHMGVGGKVVDGQLRCPFHAWRFDGAGRCTEVPYARRVPKGARARSWPTRERNGAVFVWFDPHGGAPDWEIPELPEWGAPGWSRWFHERMEIATHSREIVENVVDVAHFVPVHATDPQEFQNEFRGHVAVQQARGQGSADHKYPGASYEVLATYYGPGYQITEFRSRGVETRLLNAHTMVEPNLLHLRFGVMLRETGRPEHDARFARAYVRDLQRGFAQDVAIWENKVFREDPVLCLGDGPLMKMRRWYAQFFEPLPAAG